MSYLGYLIRLHTSLTRSLTQDGTALPGMHKTKVSCDLCPQRGHSSSSGAESEGEGLGRYLWEGSREGVRQSWSAFQFCLGCSRCECCCSHQLKTSYGKDYDQHSGFLQIAEALLVVAWRQMTNERADTNELWGVWLNPEQHGDYRHPRSVKAKTHGEVSLPP